MFWVIVIVVVVAYIGFNFFNSLNKDENELQHQSVSEKFAVIVNILNDAAFNGAAEVTPIDKREFNLYDGSTK
jgi:predicted negative regulator of RcsB-dependent stress response